MTTEYITITITKRRQADDRIHVRVEPSRLSDANLPEGAGFFEPDEDPRRVDGCPQFERMMEFIRGAAKKIVCHRFE